MITKNRFLGGALALLLATAFPVTAQQKNGFDLSNSEIPIDEILGGGPPRDGIPSIDEPKFRSSNESLPWRPEDLMMTYDGGKVPHAFPIGILNWHEIVNYNLEDEAPVLISFCPLCGTGMAFDPRVDGRYLTFGVSGLLYNSDLLMYDHQTESLWSQIEGRAISGPLVGTELEPVAIRHELWRKWKARVGSDGRVLSTDTGYNRNYRHSPYGNYDQSERLYFPVTQSSREYHPKTWVLGWTHNGESKAWPYPELESHKERTFEDTIGGKTVKVHFDAETPSAELRDESGELLPATRSFWFAWYTFHPETDIFKSDQL